MSAIATAAIHGVHVAATGAVSVIDIAGPVFVGLVVLASIGTAVWLRRYLRKYPSIGYGQGWTSRDTAAFTQADQLAIEGPKAARPAIEAPKPRPRLSSQQAGFEFAMVGEVPIDAELVDAD